MRTYGHPSATAQGSNAQQVAVLSHWEERAELDVMKLPRFYLLAPSNRVVGTVINLC